MWAAGHRPTLARRNAALAQHLLRVCIREAQTPTGGVLWGLRLLRLNKGHLKDCEACCKMLGPERLVSALSQRRRPGAHARTDVKSQAKRWESLDTNLQVVRTKRQVASCIFTRDDAHLNWQETHVIPGPHPGRGGDERCFTTVDPAPWLFTARFGVNWGSSRASSTQQQGVNR